MSFSPPNATPVSTINTPFGKNAASADSSGFLFGPASIALLVSVLLYNILTPVASTKTGVSTNVLSTIFLHPSAEAHTVIIVLCFIFTYTLCSSFRDRRALKKEESIFNEVRQSLPQTVDSDDTGRMLHAKLADVGRNTLLVQAAQAVWDARNMATPDLEAINASLDALDANRVGIGAGVGNRLMLISLLGTILGLAQVISTLDPQIKSASATGDVDAIFRNLQGTLTQMGTAFSSTAWGILLSTLLSWATSVSSASRQGYAAKVQYFAVSELAPHVLTMAPAAVLEGIKDAIRQGEQFLHETKDTLSAAADSQKQLLLNIQQTHQAMESETKSFISKVEFVFTNNANQFAQNLQGIGDYVVAGAQAQMSAAEQLDRLLLDSTKHMTGAADSLKAASSEVSGFKSAVDKTEATAQKMSTELANFAPNLQAAIAKPVQQQALALSDVEKKLKQTVDEINALATRVQPRLPSEAEMDRLRNAIEGLTKSADAMSRQGGFTVSGGSSSGSSVSPAQLKQAMDAALEPLLQQLQSSSKGDNSQITSQIATTNQQLNDLAREVRSLVQYLKSSGGAASAAFSTGTGTGHQPADSPFAREPWSPAPLPPSFWESFLNRFRR